MWHRPWGSFKLYKESIIVLAFLIISGIHQIWINKKLLQPIFVLNWILYVFHYFILNTPYLINRSIFLIFAIYVSKVNTSLKNKICFENIYFPSKFIKLCPENLKKHTDKISLRSDETQTFYWSFKYMSNYHLNLQCKLNRIRSLRNKILWSVVFGAMALVIFKQIFPGFNTFNRFKVVKCLQMTKTKCLSKLKIKWKRLFSAFYFVTFSNGGTIRQNAIARAWNHADRSNSKSKWWIHLSNYGLNDISLHCTGFDLLKKKCYWQRWEFG